MAQEHSAGKQVVDRWRGQMREKGWNMHMSPIDQETKGAGVGCMVREPIQAIPIELKTKKCRRL